jgi:tetratricopeptide (TPR) repeat protein
MDIALVGLIASIFAFRMIAMTTGRQATQPLNRGKFFLHMGVMLLLFSYCALGVLAPAWLRNLASKDSKVVENAAEARALLSEGKVPEAAGRAATALAAAEQRFGKNDPRIVPMLDLLAECCAAQLKFGDAEEFLKRALSIREKAEGEGSSAAALGEINLGALDVRRDRLAEAEAWFKRALAHSERFVGPVPPALPAALDNLADLSEKAGRADEAKAYRDRARGFRPGR